jgi:hypothetical protein
VTPEQFIQSVPGGGTCILAGLSGYGKTTALQAGLASSRRIIVIDPHSATDRRREAAGTAQRRTWEGDAWTFDELVLGNPEALHQDPARLIVDPRPRRFSQFETGKRVARLLDLVWNEGDWDVVLEEAAIYARYAVDLIHLFASGAAHVGSRLFLITQSINQLSIVPRRAASHWMLWAQVDDDDLKVALPKVGLTGVQRLRQFQKGQPPLLWMQGQQPTT